MSDLKTWKAACRALTKKRKAQEKAGKHEVMGEAWDSDPFGWSDLHDCIQAKETLPAAFNVDAAYTPDGIQNLAII